MALKASWPPAPPERMPLWEDFTRAVPITREQALQLHELPLHLQAASWAHHAGICPLARSAWRGESQGQWLITDREAAFALFAMNTPWAVIKRQRAQRVIDEIRGISPELRREANIHPQLESPWDLSASETAALSVPERSSSVQHKPFIVLEEALERWPALGLHRAWLREQWQRTRNGQGKPWWLAPGIAVRWAQNGRRLIIGQDRLERDLGWTEVARLLAHEGSAADELETQATDARAERTGDHFIWLWSGLCSLGRQQGEAVHSRLTPDHLEVWYPHWDFALRWPDPRHEVFGGKVELPTRVPIPEGHWETLKDFGNHQQELQLRRRWREASEAGKH